MNALLKVLNRCWTVEFYRRNAGLLFLVMAFAGSFLRSTEHIALAQYAMQLPLVLAIYGGIWALYALKTIQFVLQSLREPDQEILYHLRLISKGKRWSVLLFIQLNLMAPVLVYALFVLVKGYAPSAEWALLAVPLFLMGLLIGAVLIYDQALRHPNASQQRVWAPFWRQTGFKRRYPFFFIEFLFRHEPVLLFLTKIGSGLALWIVCRIYPTDTYDERLIALGVLLAAAIQGPLLHTWMGFEQQFLRVVRSLPWSLNSRAGRYVLTLALLWFPETGILLRYKPEGIDWLSQLTAAGFGLALNGLLFSSLFIKHRPMESHLTTLFWGIIGGFFLVMFRVPIGVLMLMGGLAAWIIFQKRYWKVEFSQGE